MEEGGQEVRGRAAVRMRGGEAQGGGGLANQRSTICAGDLPQRCAIAATTGSWRVWGLGVRVRVGV